MDQVSENKLKNCQESLQKFLLLGKPDTVQEIFRAIIEFCRRQEEDVDKVSGKICSQLLTILSRNILPIDTQMLCSISFCVLLTTFQKTKDALKLFKDCLSITEYSVIVKLFIDREEMNLSVKCTDSFRLCLCHGMLQSRSPTILECEYLKHQSVELKSNSEYENVARSELAQHILSVVLECCGKYSRLTYLAFRVLTTWLIKMGQTQSTSAQNIYSKIFPLLYCNWDNPLNGIRDQIARLMDLLFDLQGDQRQPLLTEIMHHQPWTVKSKYLMLATLLPKYGISKAFREFPDLPSGLLWSLSQCHLVSAGCEAYRACILDMTEEEWIHHFLYHHVQLINSQSMHDSLEMHNLFNYWIPYTLQKFPTIVNLLIIHLPPAPSIPLLCLLKLSPLYTDINELIPAIGITPLKVLTDSIRHSNESIRRLSLSIICSSAKTTLVPSYEEFQFVKDFLIENVSGDSAPFRQNIHNSCMGFMKRLYKSSMHEGKKTHSRKIQTSQYTKYDSELEVAVPDSTAHTLDPLSMSEKTSLFIDNKASDPLKRIVEFLNWLHSFVISNLEPGTNYQRRILSLRLYHLLLSTWHNESSTIAVSLSFTSESSRHALITCVLSPTEDIRETAADLLIKYFSDVSFEENLMLLKRSLDLCRSAMFYQAEGGALLLKIVATWIYKRNDFSLLASQYSPMVTHSSLSRMLVAEAKRQWSAMQENLFAAASSGSPVHGVITALQRIAADKDGPEFGRIDADCTAEMIVLMEELVEHLLAALAGRPDGATEFAPSFEDMGRAIQIATNQEKTNVKLTSAHQLLLNCVWLNFKACCLLSSGLAQKPGTDIRTVQRCAHLNVQVLTRCRHKGAIESAGASLGRLVQSLPAEQQTLAGHLLEEFLDTHTGGASVTRRSAGLAILVHKIVASDQQMDKPLVLLAVNRLIALASTPVDSEETELSDLPQAQALHILRTLLQDSSLRQHVAPSTSQVAILCFESLSSPIWTIQNAALQLFGAIASKLVGQKKPQEEDIVATAEELVSHFPHLFDYLLSRLHQALASPSLHSSVVPTLTLLSKMAVKHPHLSSSSEILTKLHSCFLPLASSHIHAVRKLSAKAFAGFTAFPCVFKTVVSLVELLLGNNRLKENEINGMLLAVTYLCERLRYESANMSKYCIDGGMNLELVLNKLHQLKEISYFNRASVSQLISSSGNWNLEYCQEICGLFESEISKDYSPCSSIGIHQWANVELESIVKLCSDEEMFPCLMRIATREGAISEAVKDAAMQRLNCDGFSNVIKSQIVASSLQLLCSVSFVCNELFFMELMLAILFDDCGRISVSFDQLKKFFEIHVQSASNGKKYFNLGLTITCGFTQNLINEDNFCIGDSFLQLFHELVDLIHSHSNVISCDEEDRSAAADALGFLAKPLVKMLSTIMVQDRYIYKTCLASTVAMLQDENSGVRNIAAKFAWNIILECNNSFTKGQVLQKCDTADSTNELSSYYPHPYFCLKTLLSPQYLSTLLGVSETTEYLWHQLDYSSELDRLSMSRSGDHLASPFEHGKSNIYVEEVKVVEWAAHYLTEMLQSEDEQTKLQFLTSAHKISSHHPRDAALILELASTNVGDPSDVYLIAKQLHCQHKLLNTFMKTTGGDWIAPLDHFVQHLGMVL